MAKLTLQEQADRILQEAEKAGLKENFLFKTTFQRYITLMNYLGRLEKSINDEGVLVTKEYVKKRANLYVNPALTAYNTTVSSANATVKTLVHIVATFKGEQTEDSRLMQFLNELKADE